MKRQRPKPNTRQTEAVARCRDPDRTVARGGIREPLHRWPGELTVLHASGEGIPFGRSEDQRRAGRVLRVANADATVAQPGDFHTFRAGLAVAAFEPRCTGKAHVHCSYSFAIFLSSALLSTGFSEASCRAAETAP